MRNPDALITRSPKEWGHKDRKEEAHNRGHRRRGKRDAIEDQLSSN